MATTASMANQSVAAGEAATKKALRGIRARVIEVPVEKKIDPSTKGSPRPETKVSEDPFHELEHRGLILIPPFDPLTLAMLPENSTELGQCIEAMAVNIEGFGHRFIPRIKSDDPEVAAQMDEATKNAIRDERCKLINFFQHCTQDISFTEFRKRLRKDLESGGNGYFEVVRNAAGRLQSLIHIPGWQMRLSKQDVDPVMVEKPVLELQPDNSVKIVKVKEWRRFRKFVQQRTIFLRNLESIAGHRVRWFKEYGDKRHYDNKTGREVVDPAEIAKLREKNQLANEVVHLKIYSPRTPYGLPRYIGNLLTIFGDRAAEEVNYVTFRNNNIPSMLLMVSNGQLTEGTIERIESFVESQIQGSDNYSKFLIIEAEAQYEGEDAGQIKLDSKPLTDTQHKDALFQNYSKNNRDQIRRAFRLPPIFVGRSDDYTRATAESSRKLADEQIFAPERDEFDNWINKMLMPELGAIYHKFKSNSPNTTDNTQLVKILAGAEKTGGMTPAIARAILEDILSLELPEFPEGFPKDVPFSLTMAEAVKNKADASEPGQQVTALKGATVTEALKALGFEPAHVNVGTQEGEGDGAAFFEAECTKCGNTELVSNLDQSDDPVVSHLVRLNKRLEAKWQAEVQKGTGDDEPDLGIDDDDDPDSIRP